MTNILVDIKLTFNMSVQNLWKYSFSLNLKDSEDFFPNFYK